MKYYRICLSNGLCGCDEDYAGFTENDDCTITLDELLDMYTYTDGYAGIENEIDEFLEINEDEGLTEDDFWDDYTDTIKENSEVTEISEEEFEELKNIGWDTVEIF